MRSLSTLTTLFLALLLVLVTPLATRAAPGDIAVYFGSFDPPHVGHLAVAKGALPDLGVEKVFLVPTRGIAGKEHVASYEDRYAMCKRLASSEPGLGVLSRTLLDRAWHDGGVSGWRHHVYEALYQQLPPSAMVLDIIGMDRFNMLLHTREYPGKDEARMVVVVDRPGHLLDPELVAKSGVPAGKFLFLHPPVRDVQAEQVRRKLSRGKRVDREVPGVVLRHIREQGLYRRGARNIPGR